MFTEKEKLVHDTALINEPGRKSLIFSNLEKEILFDKILKLKSSKYLDVTYEILISVFID